MNGKPKNYVQRVSRNKVARQTLTQDELNALFVKAGWIGVRRQPVLFIKTAPHIDRGSIQ